MPKDGGILIALGKPKADEGDDVDEMKLGAMRSFIKAVKAGDEDTAVEEFKILYDLCKESSAKAASEEESEEY